MIWQTLAAFLGGALLVALAALWLVMRRPTDTEEEEKPDRPTDAHQHVTITHEELADAIPDDTLPDDDVRRLRAERLAKEALDLEAAARERKRELDEKLQREFDSLLDD